jgi:predicted ATPase/class 3 adenylate cyclase
LGLPEGTVTFLRSDIEGSMELARALGPRYDELNSEHAAIIRALLVHHGGYIVGTEGDSFFGTFVEAGAAARAAVDIQRQMAEHDWPEGHPFRVRIGIHVGAATRAGDDYGGFEVSRAARVAAAGWGGQIILSDAARALVAEDMPSGWVVRDLGWHRLKGIPEPERLFGLEADGLPTRFPPLRTGVSPVDRLPERVTTLVGRDMELESLDELLRQTRLLTLTGPGGTGKTTLALELARRHAADYADGAAFVDLQAIRDSALVRAEIAHGLGLLDGSVGSAADRLSAYLGSRELLLVIDNFEQVLDAATVVADVFADSSGSRIVVTSRVPLRLRAEQEFPVGPLPVEGEVAGASSDAERLFIERARRVRPDAIVDAMDARLVAEICRLVDGLPLAIELCAARVGTLPLGTIRDRLRDRRPLPVSGPRDLPDRQRTIEETVAWSHDLLTPALRRLLRRLAAFEESVDLAQAEMVCGPADELGIDVLDGLVQLADHSLLTHVDGVVDGPRFGWLETIRRFALDRLAASGEHEMIRMRHARAFADLAAEAGSHLPSGRQAHWLDRLEADQANLRAATLHAIESGDVESAMRLVSGLWRYWLQSGRVIEGRALVERVLAMPGAANPSTLRVRTLDALGSLAYWAGDRARAGATYDEELELARRIGDRPGEALALLDLFFTHDVVGDLDGALSIRDASRAIYEELGDGFGLARLEQSTFLILIARRLKDPVTLMAELEEHAAAAEAMADPWLSRNAMAFRGLACLMKGDPRGMLEWVVRAQRVNLMLRERAEVAFSLQFAVLVAPMLGRADMAATIHGAALAASAQLGIRPNVSYQDLIGTDPLPMLIETLSQEGFEEAVERGRRLSLEEAVDLVQEAATTA